MPFGSSFGVPKAIQEATSLSKRFEAVLEASWKRLGRVLSASWGAIEVSWRPLGAPLASFCLLWKRFFTHDRF